MELSPKLAAKFELLQNRYPVKRSALIPMMMYAQDEYGYISDDMVNELADRLDLRPVQVEETLAYYSMLHRKPVGQASRAGLHQRGLHAARRRANSCSTPRSAWKSATRKPRRTAFFRWKKWNVSAPAPAPRPCR